MSRAKMLADTIKGGNTMSFNTGEYQDRHELPPLEGAALFAGLMDELIPGGNGWPSASSVGVQSLVAIRLSEQAGEAVLGRIVDAMIAAGGPLAGRSMRERVVIVKNFEAAEPELFEQVRIATTFAYYENPFVVEAIRRQGRPYALRPHLLGYPMRSFDFDKDAPRHKRGAYTATDRVMPVDISTLHLEENRTKRWGIKR